MESVEKKKKRRGWGRPIRLVVAGALFLGCLLLAFLWGREPEEMPRREEHGGVLIRMEKTEISDVTIVRRGKDSWTMVQDEDGRTHLEGETAWTADETLTARLLDALANLEYEEILTEDGEDWKKTPEDFGLAEPLITAVLRTRDGGLMTVRVGNAVETSEDSLYYMSVDNGDTLYAVSAGFFQDLNLNREQLRPVTQPEILEALLDRINFRFADGTERNWQLRGEVTDSEAGTEWLITEPFTYPADEESIGNLKSAASGLRLGAWVAEATEEQLAEYGLKEPACTLTFHMAAGTTGTVNDSGVYDLREHAARTVTLEIGKERSELTRYARFEDAIVTISLVSLNSLLNTEPAETAARYLTLVPWNSLTQMTVTDGGETVVYEKLSEEGETRWLKNGSEISAEALEAAYDRLAVVTVSGELPPGTQPGEATKTCVFRTSGGREHTVMLSNYDGLHDCVTLDGYTRFYLIKDGMTELP